MWRSGVSNDILRLGVAHLRDVMGCNILSILFTECCLMPFLRRDGPNWFESRVLLTTQPNNATPATNCSSPGADTDYCSLLVEVVFPPGETRATQNVSIIDDSIAEGPESLILSLLNPNSTIIREEYNTATVIITDESDCKSTHIGYSFLFCFFLFFIIKDNN